MLSLSFLYHYLFFSFLLFGQFDGCLIFSLINQYFLKSGNDIYWFVFFFSFSFSFFVVIGFDSLFSVCVLCGALSSSYYFCLLFFLHLSITLYIYIYIYIFFFFLVLGWHINNFFRLHSRHTGWIRVSEVVVNLSSSC